uniref:Alanine dehydrogenase n=1 Tax=Thermosporothrix sp. COM3 TaxID=2490863 RepID=A0A455SCA5_9CHLR|nr:alanine dehydrogenase [Thermosporothrix sp. COM3]
MLYMTLLLSRSEVEPFLQPGPILEALRCAFPAYSLKRSAAALRVRAEVPGKTGARAIVLLPGVLEDIPAYTVKVHAKVPGMQPAIQGVLLLHDLHTGRLLAVMDSTAITALRTGLCGALAADVLARSDASRVAIIGAGVQGRLQLRCLRLVRSLSQVRVFDVEPQEAYRFAQEMQEELHFPVLAETSVEAAVRDAEIIVTVTWAREPFLFASMVQPGTHISTLGPDEPGKCEVGADLLQHSLFVCDDRALAVSMGAIGGAGLDEQAIDAELGEVLAGVKAGRSFAEQLTVYGGVGLAFQDLVACWHVYQEALRAGQGQTIDFLG